MDNGYPNNGQAIGVYETGPDKKQEKAARVELNTVAASYPVMAEVLAWFDEQINDSGNILNIDLDEAKVPAAAQVLAYRKLAELLFHKREDFRTKFEAYERDREAKR